LGIEWVFGLRMKFIVAFVTNKDFVSVIFHIQTNVFHMPSICVRSTGATSVNWHSSVTPCRTSFHSSSKYGCCKNTSAFAHLLSDPTSTSSMVPIPRSRRSSLLVKFTATGIPLSFVPLLNSSVTWDETWKYPCKLRPSFEMDCHHSFISRLGSRKMKGYLRSFAIPQGNAFVPSGSVSFFLGMRFR
jgi:hypothetical protein